MSARLQRPAPPCRTVSASSFAETFDIARRNLEDQLHLEEDDSDIDAPVSPDLDATATATPTLSSNTLTPASLSTPPTEVATPRNPNEDVVADNFAFAFDIDGVLVRGGNPIPEAIEAMKMLNGENEYGIRV